MKPPHCVLCKKNFRKNPEVVFRLVRFKRTAEQEKAHQEMDKLRKIGHPDNAFWFCEDHYENARNHSHLTSIDYFEGLKKN